MTRVTRANCQLCVSQSKIASKLCRNCNEIAPTALFVLIDNLGGRTVVAGVKLLMPLALLVLIFDRLVLARHLLLGGGALCRGESFGMGGKGLGEHIADLVGE